MMTKGDREGWIFLSHSHTISWSPINTSFYIGKHEKCLICRDATYVWYGDVFHKIALTPRMDVKTASGRCAAVRFFIDSTGWYGVCEIEISHMG